MNALRVTLFTLSFLATGCLSIIPAMAPKAENIQPKISAAFPYESQFVEVHGSKMHYVEQGQGDPIVLLHGNPTSSYLWRNVIPGLSVQGRVIAVDMIGFGKSDKPNLPYRFEDHVKYFEGFVEAMGLTNVTLVLHDWGGGVGLDYAMRHEDNVRGIALMEAVMRPMSMKKDGSPVEQYLFGVLRDPKDGHQVAAVDNYFVEKMLPMMSGRTLTDAEMKAYRAPFPTVASRKPVAQWPREIPLDGEPERTTTRIDATYKRLQKSDVPLLLLYAEPGMIVKPKFRAQLAKELPRMKMASVGSGMHYIQETQPKKISALVAAWYQTLPAPSVPTPDTAE